MVHKQTALGRTCQPGERIETDFSARNACGDMTSEQPVCQAARHGASSCFRVVVQCNANSASVVTIVLPDDGLVLQLPKPGVMIRAGRHQVRRVCREGAVPYPSLVAVQLLLELEAILFAFVAIRASQRSSLLCSLKIHLPDLCRMVCGAGCEVPHIRAEQHTGDVRAMSAILSHWYQGRDIAHGDQAPHEDRACDAVGDCCAEERSICSDCDGGNRLVLFGYELMAALVLAQIPDSNVSASVAGDELALIRVNNDVVDRYAVRVIALNMAAAGIPDFHRACEWISPGNM